MKEIKLKETLLASNFFNIYVNAEINTLDDLIYNFFSYATYFNEYKGGETYFNKECTSVQCVKNKYRSFDEFCMCVLTYFPDITVEYLMKTLLKTRIRNSSPILSSCPDIGRLTICFYNFRRSYTDVIRADKFNSPYNYLDIFKMANIDKDMYNKLLTIKT